MDRERQPEPGTPRASSPARTPILRGLPARTNHSVQFYERDGFLVESVARFIRRGLQQGDAAIVIATEPHLRAIEESLHASGIDTRSAVDRDTLVMREATETIEELFVDGMPDPTRFSRFLGEIVARARRSRPFRRIRAYGEMVDLLWHNGKAAAVLRLEELWTKLIDTHSIELLCGYRINAFANSDHCGAFTDICGSHSRVMPSEPLMRLDDGRRNHAIAKLEQRAAALEAEIERRRRAESVRDALFALAAEVNGAVTLEELHQPAFEALGSLLKVELAAILLCDAAGALRPAAQRGLSDRVQAAIASCTPWPKLDPNRGPVVLHAGQGHQAAQCSELWVEGIASVGFVPLCQRGELLGAFVLCAAEAPAPFECDLRLALEVAQHVAQAVYRARLFELEKTARQEAEAATMARDEVLAVVSHDLRNPLGVIKVGAANVLRTLAKGNGANGGRIQRSAEMILEAADRMSRLIADLLDLGTMRGGRFTIEAADCVPSEIVAATVDMIGALAGDRKLQLKTRVEDNRALRCDRDRLIQALGNLATNAIHVTPDGGTVTLGACAGPTEFTFFVEDDGPGLSHDELPRLFERYWRGSNSTYNGTGLGLSIAKGIVDAHGGRIWAENASGGGSRFSFSVPSCASPDRRPARNPAPHSAPAQRVERTARELVAPERQHPVG